MLYIFYIMYMTPLFSSVGAVLLNVGRVKCLSFLNLVTTVNRH